MLKRCTQKFVVRDRSTMEMMNLLRLAWVVSYLTIQVHCTDYEAEFVTKKIKVEELEKKLSDLSIKLETALKDRTLEDERKKVQNNMKSRLDKVKQLGREYREKLDTEMKGKISNQIQDIVDFVQNEGVKDSYNLKFGRLLKNIKDYTNSYDKKAEPLQKTVNTVGNRVDEVETKFDELKDPIENILESLTWTVKEKQARLDKIKKLQDEFYELTKQVQSDNFHEEEKQRSDGNSGIKQIRSTSTGSKNYYSNTHSGRTFSAIHTHSNNIRTVGMGEFIGVLNGVEFRTRHNDYRLKQPVADNKAFHAAEDVKFPDVPPEVLNAGDVSEQTEEMRKWFKAFHEQDYSVRDYRKYFKPILVYLEGAWTVGDQAGKIDEPFESDRHQIDATSWLDLQEKVRFTSYTGSKSLLENLAHLPTKIVGFTKDKQPILAQWNYRIICHPIDVDVPTKFLKLVPDAAVQQQRKMTDASYRLSRAAKFELEGLDLEGNRVDGPVRYSFLDKIMSKVPGKDNYGSYIEAKAFNASDHVLRSADPNSNIKLNAAYYHRAYVQHDSTGQQVYEGQRGFSDRLFVAHTTQDKIASSSYKADNGDIVNTKVSYAIPVELVYLTPLHSWNPYNIPYGQASVGTGTVDSPYTVINSRTYYRTPANFFTGAGDFDPADTTKSSGVIVQKSDGTKHRVVESGTRIFFPTIEGVGDVKIRQRYPIMPVFGEGSAVWKKVNAIEDMLNIQSPTQDVILTFQTGDSHSSTFTLHHHFVEISKTDHEKLINGDIQSLKILTQRANSHSHEITIGVKDGMNGKVLFIEKCDSSTNNGAANQICFDNHENTLAK